MTQTTFINPLESELRNFDLARAQALSDQIHEFEAQGGTLSATEDRLWLKLTEKIMEIDSGNSA